MNRHARKLALVVTSAALMVLVGCGGGGSGSTVVTPSILSGTAATGAAFTDASITVTDSSGATVGSSSSPVGADGTFIITLSAGASPPFVLTAKRTSADGDVSTLVSVVPSTAVGGTTTVNITPITNLIASRLSPSGDPANLAAELAAKTSSITDTTVAGKVGEVQTILAPILSATLTGSMNPLTSAFSVNGDGYDRLLDSLAITITASSATATNIAINIRLQQADGAAPNMIQFTSQDAIASIPVMAAVDPLALVAPGTATLIADHMAQLNRCFALPLSARIASGGTVATDIVATECKSAFFSNNPSSYKSNGNSVAKGRSFNGIFVDGGTGIVFSQGTYEFTRGNGDIVAGYRSRSAAGDVTFDTFALRKDGDGKLKQIGNQYDYAGGISASHQLREQITLSQQAYNYYSTGFDLNLPDAKSGGVSIYDHVTVTSPKGRTFMLYPVAGRSSLVLAYDYAPNPSNTAIPGGTAGGIGGLGNTSYIRLRSEYASSSTPASPHPAAKEAARTYFAKPANYPDDSSISALPAQSVWKFDYYLATAPTVIAATQQYKTRSRPLTIAELRYQGLMQLDPGVIAQIQAASDDGTTPQPGQTLLPTAAPLAAFTWSVPTGALPPTAVTLFGLISGTSNAFDDGTNKFGSSSRSAQVLCSYSGSGTNQCNGSGNGAYVATTYMNGISFGGTDATGRSFSKYYNMSKMRP